MNFKELIQRTAADTNLPQQTVKKVCESAMSVISDELCLGGEATLGPLGKLTVETVPARTLTTPRGATIYTPAHLAVEFKPSKALKEAVA